MSSGIDHSKEIDFWARCIEESGEPVLELGSGTGRILVPLLERGFEIVGIDTSEDMLIIKIENVLTLNKYINYLGMEREEAIDGR